MPPHICRAAPGLVLVALLMLGPQTAKAQSYITQWNACGDDVSVSPAGEVLLIRGGPGEPLIHRYTNDGVFLGDYETGGNPRSITTDIHGNIFVLCQLSSFDQWDIQKLASDGIVLTHWSVGSGINEFGTPQAIAVDGSGVVSLTCAGGSESPCGTSRFSSDGLHLGFWPMIQGLKAAADIQGNLYLASITPPPNALIDDMIRKYNNAGALVAEWGGTGAGPGQFSGIGDLAVDASGNVFATDRGNNRVQKFSSSGAFLAEWGHSGSGNGEFSRPGGIDVDSDGRIYVLDSGNCRVQVFGDLATPGRHRSWGQVKAIYR